MDFLEKMILFFGVKKSLESIDESRNKPKKRNLFGVATYSGLRQTYYSIEDYPDYLLDELFRREPDHIDGETGPDCREYLNLNMSQYKHKDQTIYGDTWFTLSINNRLLCNAFLDGLLNEDLRNYNLIDFSSKPFNAIGNPNSRSIKIGDYTLYFNHPYHYNLTLMLLKRADEQFATSPSISSRAIKLPNVIITDELLKEYDITSDINSNDGVQLKNASYAVLTDFNSENNYEKGAGTITLRVVDGNETTSDYYTPCTIYDLLLRKDCVKNGMLWISIAPSPTKSSMYLLGTQFMFLETAEDVIIRGNPDTCELYVCRTSDGWGGIKFKLQNKKDYYQAATWLITAISLYCYGLKGWDYKSNIEKYWPSYPNI